MEVIIVDETDETDEIGRLAAGDLRDDCQQTWAAKPVWQPL